MNRRPRSTTHARGSRLPGVALAVIAMMLLNPSAAQALAATKVTPSLAFSGTGTAQSIVTKVSFTSTYTGAYYVRYDIYRSASKTKTSPVRMTTTTISQTFSTAKGKVYTTAVTAKSCAPNSTKTTYYYWLVGSVSDGGTGIATINSTPVAKIACTSVF